MQNEFVFIEFSLLILTVMVRVFICINLLWVANFFLLSEYVKTNYSSDASGNRSSDKRQRIKNHYNQQSSQQQKKIRNVSQNQHSTCLCLLGSFPFVTSANTHNSCYAVEPSCPNSSKNVIQSADIIVVWSLAQICITNYNANLRICQTTFNLLLTKARAKERKTLSVLNHTVRTVVNAQRNMLKIERPRSPLGLKRGYCDFIMMLTDEN